MGNRLKNPCFKKKDTLMIKGVFQAAVEHLYMFRKTERMLQAISHSRP